MADEEGSHPSILTASENVLSCKISQLLRVDNETSEYGKDIDADALQVLCSFIVERKEDILACDADDEEYFSVFIAVIGHKIRELFDTCEAFADITLKATDVIIHFCLNRIKHEREKSFISQLMYVKVLDIIYNGQECTETSELKPFEKALKNIPMPQSMKDYNFEIGTQSSQFGLIFASCLKQVKHELSLKQARPSSDWPEQFKSKCSQSLRRFGAGPTLLEFALHLPFLSLFNCYFEKKLSPEEKIKPQVSTNSIEQFSEELSAVNRIAGLQNVITLNREQLLILTEVVRGSLKAAFFIAIGCYEVPDANYNEDSCRKFAWRATESCLSIFRTALLNLDASSQFGCSVCQNLQAIAIDNILVGFDLALQGAANTDDAAEQANEARRKWKWFSGLNIMLVTMASKLVMLISTLSDNLCLEDEPTTEQIEQDVIKGDLLVDRNYSAWHRSKWLLTKNNIPLQLWKLFCASYSMANSVKSLKTALPVQETEEYQTDANETAKMHSEENSEEEGSLLGKWLENILSESIKLRPENKEVKGEESKSESAYSQSFDIFVLLANSLLDLCVKLFPTLIKYNLGDVVKKNFGKDGIESLAKMIVEIDKTAEDLGSKEDLIYYMFSFITMLQSSEIINGEKLEQLLTELGLCATTDGSKWPLYIPKLSLSLFGRLALSEQERCLRDELDSADTPRVINAWEMLIDRLVSQDEAVLAHTLTHDLNVEHLQLMALLYVNLSKETKAKLVRKCFAGLKGIGGPLLGSRLVLIADFMIRGFTEVPEQLFHQVVKNILSIPMQKWEGASTTDFISCTFKEEEIYRNLTKKLNLTNPQMLSMQMQPRFYELLPENFCKRPSHATVLQALTDASDITSDSYKQFYTTFLALCCDMLSFIELHQAKDEEIIEVMGARSSFLHLWKFLLCLPTPLSLLNEIVNPKKVLESPELLLFFLRVMPFMFVKVNISRQDLVKELLIFDELITEEATSIINEVMEECCKTSYICELASCFEPTETVKNWSHLLLSDGITSFILVMLERFVMDKEEQEHDNLNIGKLASVILKNIALCHQKIKLAIISQQKEPVSDDILGIYAKIIDVRVSHLVKDVVEIDFTNGLPCEIREATERWKDILLTQFPVPKPKTEDCKGLENFEFASFIDGLLAAHVTVFATGKSFPGVACTLKHLLKSLVDLFQVVLDWLKSRSSDQFQLIQVEVITVFINLITDVTVDHVSQTVTHVLETAIGDDEADKMQQILHSHLLSLCFFVVEEEIIHEDRFVTNEQTVLQCLSYIEASLQRSIDTSSAASYFSSEYHLKLASILLSIRLEKFSKNYVSKVLQMFSNVLASGDNAQRGSVRQAIVHIFSLSSSDLEDWLFREVISDVGSDSSTNGSITSLQKFVNCVIQEKTNLLEVLTSAGSVYGKLINRHISAPAESQNTPYEEFMDILISLASAIGAKGHVTLLKSVYSCWRPVALIDLCENLVLASSNESLLDEDLVSCVTSLLRYIVMILTAIKKYRAKDGSSVGLQITDTDSESPSRDRHDHDFDEDVNSEDEDSGDESDDESLCNKLCTFTVTQRDFMNQHWYHCHTCNMNDGVGCCSVCVKVCHKDHKVSYAKYGSFFCDCGAKDDGSCKAMVKRASAVGPSDRGAKSAAPFTAWTNEKSSGDSKHNSTHESKASLTKGKSLDKKTPSANWTKGSLYSLSSVLEGSEEEIMEILREENDTCVPGYVLLLQSLYDYLEKSSNKLAGDQSSLSNLQSILQQMYTSDKDVQSSEQLMIPILGSQEGAFDSVRLKFSGEQGQTIRQLINAHVLRHTAMCLMVSQNGKRQHLAVTHEKGKITILQLSGLLKQPDTTSRKLTLNRLSSTTLPFTVISINSNVESEDVLAVCGLKDCHIITYGHAGSVASHIALPLQLETGNFVIKTVWVPGSQTELALLTADFVKVYNLAKSTGSPTHHYILPGGKVRDVTFINDGNVSRIAVMSSHGHIYTETMNEASSASGGPFFLTNVINASHSSLKDSNGQLAGGGVSLYYSHAMKLMCFSYVKGKSFVGVLNDDLSGMDRIFSISSAVANHAALCNWNEIAGQPGLLHCVNQTTGNPVMIMIRPDRILVQDIKTTPAKSKIQDAVCYYHVYPITRNCDTTMQQKTVMIVLLEDGSLRIYNANKDETQYWLQPQFKPKNFVQPCQVTRKGKTSRPANPSAIHTNATSFPIDFFEYCEPTVDVEFGGADILHVYNSAQAKNRLYTAGMYIANTKPSGFKVEITNTNTSNVLVGLRIHVGVRSVDKTPTYIEVFGRIIPLRLSRHRWFDIPFSRAESLTADKKVTVTFGPSSDSSGISMVDSISVYCKTKEAFGWPEDASEPAAVGSPVHSPHDSRTLPATTESVQAVELSTAESLLGKLLETVIENMACFPITNSHSELHDKLLSFATKLVTSKRHSLIQSQAKSLLASLFSSKNEFFDKKDEAQLFHALEQFKSSNEVDQLVIGPSYAEIVLDVLSVARSIANARPNNLIRLLKDFDKEANTLNDIMSAFWKLYKLRPVNCFLAPISTRAIGTLDGTVEALVEILFAVLLADSENFKDIAEIIISLLLKQDPSVSFATKQGISQALKIRKKVNVVAEQIPDAPSPCPAPPVQEAATDQENSQVQPAQESSPAPDEIEVIPESYADPYMDLEPQQSGLQAFLGDSLSVTAEEVDTFKEDQDSPREKSNEATTSNDDKQSSIAKQKQTVIEITDSALQACWQKLFSVFVDHLPDIRNVHGVQAIPYLQVLLMFCSNLSDSEEDRKNLEKVIFECLKQLDPAEDTFKNVSDRSAKKEVHLIIIRFFSILMSQTRSPKEAKQTDESKSVKGKLKPSKTVAKILANEGILKYCLDILKNLLSYWRQLRFLSSADPSSEAEVLLKSHGPHSTPDMSPFFLKQYVKSHANDLFETFPQLVTEMVLRIPYQIRKRLEGVSDFEISHFGQEWIEILCEYMIATDAPFVRRHVRKLLLALCGSKERYRRVKDLHTLKSYTDIIRGIISITQAADRPANFPYEETVKLADNAKACVDIAMIRNNNWQIFCRQEKGVLPFLVQASCQLSSEHVSGIFLQLIGLALGNSCAKQGSSTKEKSNDEEDVKALVCLLFEQCYSSLLFNFIKFFLLESNSTSMRWKAHELLHTIFVNISEDQQLRLIELMWQLWNFVPSSGHKAAQFVDLLGYITVKTPKAKKMIPKYTNTVLSLLSYANEILKNHPNASVYRRLQGLVEVTGFYLENDPCMVCNNPEISFTHAKLNSIKSDIRYTTTAQLVKLNVSYTISRLLLRISDIKRAKMVKTINIYYNNKAVPSVVELKNKRNIWQHAKRINLSAEQTDVKVDFTLPIVAYNLMIEYAEFYDNIQLSAESLQCPRCSASVPANPGVCGNCGENVYQCHKCRAINYDERDPFLCTSCGFCKYAKFEFTLVTRPCCAVEPVTGETDRQKALSAVNSSLDSADKIYVQLSAHKQSLEVLLRNACEESAATSKAGAVSVSGSSVSAIAAQQVNKNIQSIAQKYCLDCKISFEELSKIIQKVTAIRKELTAYDILQQEALSTIVSASPGASPISQKDFSPGFASPTSSQQLRKWNGSKDGREKMTIGKCYGCVLSTAEHCLTVLRAIATIKDSHELMLKKHLLNELLEHNLQQRKVQVTSLARNLIIMITKGSACATDELNRMIMKQVSLCLESNAANVVTDISLQNQMSVLGLSLNTFDQCWGQRLRCVLNLFLDSVKLNNADVAENVTLPCLKILAECMQKVSKSEDDKAVKRSDVAAQGINALKWLKSSKYSLQYWRARNKEPTRSEYLAEKYASIWMSKVQAKSLEPRHDGMNGEKWLRLLLFSPSSRAIRETVCGILENLSKVDHKKEKLLQLFTRYLEDLHDAGENASDFLKFFKLLITPPNWKKHLVTCGILDKLTELIVKEVDYLSSMENKTTGFDLSQGYALHALAEILKIFFEDDVVKTTFKSRFVGCVLQCYLSLRRLVVQRTKLIDAAQDILLSLLEQLTTGTEAEERSFMAICLEALNAYPVMDIRTPVFIYERLCNIIYKEEKEVNEFFIIIEKDPQQEDFLQGRMPGNPYSSKEAGLGPLMRDVKNKICTECELVALLEDDTGMELLVNNKIISLDLPVADVYKKIWCAKGERQEAMKIVYRMRGLLGDATEDMVDDLETDKDKDVDEEHEYRQAAVISEVGGLDIILKRLSYIRDLSRAQDLIFVMLKLLEYCVKVKVNRQYLGKPSVNALKIMLGTLNLALRLEKEKGSGSGGAMIAEKLLNIMGIVLHEASTQADQYEFATLPGEESQLELLLGHITSPYVRANANVLEAMMRLIPSLSFGSEQSMHTLVDHFLPYLDFNKFDDERSPNETLYLDCFCVITNGISNTTSGSRLKDLINSSGIPKQAMEYLNEHTPPKSFSASGILDANRWKEMLARPALPYVLKILTGLVTGHSATQDLVGTEENIALLHRLEQVSSEENVGTLAENLIEALRENPDVAKKVTDKGQIKAKPSSVIKEMEELLEEKGLVCCICREGYKFHPKKVLGVYTYTTRCVLEEFEGKQRKTQGYTTVSHFNVVHIDCHKEAIRHARSRDEWESAALQNANTRCNGLMPIWGPKASISKALFMSLVKYEMPTALSI
eukprot:gene6454-7186_t